MDYIDNTTFSARMNRRQRRLFRLVKEHGNQERRCLRRLARAFVEAIEAERAHPSTREDREMRRLNFAYGNIRFSNPDVTREMVDRVADEMSGEAFIEGLKQ